jgi:hypothetical protein
MKKIIALLAVCVLTLGPAIRPRACCMPPRDYKGTIGQTAQEAVMFFADGREELILKIKYHLTGESMPDRFAWIITVPSEPDAYALAPENLYEDVFNWTEQLIHPPTRSKSKSEGIVMPVKPAAGLEFGKKVTVGPYDIQPVRALGKDALTAMNDWLDKNGFPTEDPAHMTYFAENKFTFLCIKISPPENEKTVAAAAGVKPLHLSFKSERPYYPLKFSSRQGVFDVRLTMLTAKPLDYTKSEASLKKLEYNSRFMHNINVKSDAFPKTLKDVLRSKESGLRTHAGDWNLNVVEGHAVNSNNSIAGWKEDVFFEL